VGLPFIVCPQEVDETFTARRAGNGRAEAVRLAEKKLTSLLANLDPNLRDTWKLAADTFILGPAFTGAPGAGPFWGKPRDREEAGAMLRLLSGRTHRVITGLALADPQGRIYTGAETTRVHFAPLPKPSLEAYLDTGEWEGAAGAYRIQGRGETLVQWIKGSYTNVMGLPLYRLYAMLKENGYPL
jgi:septum formation protein